MNRVQKSACRRAFEDCAAEHAEDKRRPGLITDGKRAFSVRLGDFTACIKHPNSLCARRIAAKKAEQKRAARCGRQTQKLCRRAAESRGKPRRKAEQQE